MLRGAWGGPGGPAGLCSDKPDWETPRQQPGTEGKGWAGSLCWAETQQEEGSQHQWMSQPLHASVSLFVAGAPAWVS